MRSVQLTFLAILTILAVVSYRLWNKPTCETDASPCAETPGYYIMSTRPESTSIWYINPGNEHIDYSVGDKIKIDDGPEQEIKRIFQRTKTSGDVEMVYVIADVVAE